MLYARYATLNLSNLVHRFPFPLSIVPYSPSARNRTITSLSSSKFEKIADETLVSLHDYFEDIIEKCDLVNKDTDTSLNGGVLIVAFGPAHGTYVLNKQLPNKQIWLSSPVSGPKRYDYDAHSDCWMYKHDNRTLHQLLQDEVSKIVRMDLNFFSCEHCGAGQSS